MVSHGGESADDLRLTLERIQTQSKGKMSQYHRDLLDWTKNVDKRYAWVILTALWFMMCATLGPYRVYGLIYAKVTADKVYTREEATWPVSTIFTVENIVGPFVSIIAYHISYRQSMLIGGTLLALGNGLTALSQSLILDVILIGFVQGIGYAFIFMPFMEIINNYFLKYRNIALGLALCGGTLSIFALQPLFQWLLVAYPWRYSYFALGLICCINLIMVPLLRPNPKPKMLQQEQKQGVKKMNSVNGGSLSKMSMRALAYQNSIRRQSTILISRKPGTGPANLQRQASIISVNPFASSVGLGRKISRAIAIQEGQSMEDESKLPSPQPTINEQQQQQQKERPKSMALSGHFTPPQNNHLHSDQLDEQFESMSLGEVGDLQESDFDLSIIWDVIKTPGFHLIWYNELLYFWVFSIYCLIMVDYGVDRGCSRDEAESLLSYQSIGELVGRLVLTIFVDMRFTSNKNVVTLVLLTMAALLTVITFVGGYIWMASLTVSISALASLLYILLNGLLVDYLGERKVTLGYGMASCIGGVLMSFRPQAVGFFRDNLGSYDQLMHCLAGSCAFGALLWMIEPIITRAVRKANPEARGNTDEGGSSVVDLA